MKLWMGIDPGMNGGLGFLGFDDTGQYFELVVKMPETEGDLVDLFKEYGPFVKMALIEKVHSMPKQGVASSFKFGVNYGLLRGLLKGFMIPFDEILPQRWQKELGCLTRGDKNVTKRKAQQLFPRLKITHSTADALLITTYCRRKYEP